MACKKWYMGTNTKAYKTSSQTIQYLRRLGELTADIDRKDLELFVFPSAIALENAIRDTAPDRIRLGAQNMVWEEGQYTGEISPNMLSEIGCDLVLIGHSERRHVFRETDEMENQKVRSALDKGFIVLLCIGETEKEKEQDVSDEVLRLQLERDLQLVPAKSVSRLWIAYEPVWAIGTEGKPVQIPYADERLSFIRSVLVERFGKAGWDIPIFYGGSVNPQNMIPLSHCREINGLFIGRSAWDADAFNAIIRSVLSDRKQQL